MDKWDNRSDGFTHTHIMQYSTVQYGIVKTIKTIKTIHTLLYRTNETCRQDSWYFAHCTL